MGRVLLLAVCLQSLPVPAHAQALDAHAGDWTWVGDEEERRGIARAIQTAVASMSTISANIARMRLALANEPPTRLSIRFEPDETIVRFDDLEVRVPTSGSRRVLGPGGERGRASQEVASNQLRLEFRSVRGTRHVAFDLQADRLVMTVRIESPHLDQDVRYSLTYRRA